MFSLARGFDSLLDMLKFRTKYTYLEVKQEEGIEETSDGEIIHKRPGDPRVACIGRFLRKCSLDGLLQLFNVLIGDMSLVRPRPDLPWLVNEHDSWQRKLFAVQQGITRWWQVNCRCD